MRTGAGTGAEDFAYWPGSKKEFLSRQVNGPISSPCKSGLPFYLPKDNILDYWHEMREAVRHERALGREWVAIAAYRV